MSISHDLIDRYGVAVRVMASRLARRWRIDRDDVRQDLYLLLLVDGSRFDPKRGGITLWLRWRWYNLQRQERRHTQMSDEVLNTLTAETNDPARITACSEDIEELRSVLQNLPSADREVLESGFGIGGREIRNMSEIAAHRCVTSQRISQRRRRCFERLRRLLSHFND